MCRFNSDLLKTRPDSRDAAVSWMCSLVVGKFDIWAKRGVHVVWSDGAVRAYDQWLINYAEAWLDGVSVSDSFRLVVPADFLLSELRLCLTGRVEWWKAEARRYVAEQAVAGRAVVLASAAPPPIRGERNPKVAVRRTELRNILKSKRRLTAREVCVRWDFKNILLPDEWLKKGFKTWTQAYDDRAFRPKVKKLVSIDISRVLERRR